MRSSTRKAVRVRVSMGVLALTLVACTASAGAVVVGDHSTDAAEHQRARAFVVQDRSLDRIETLKGGAFSR
jgi:hypothetical protein